MLRKSFAQIIGEYSVSIPNEYRKLYFLFYTEVVYKETINSYNEKDLSLYDLVGSNFRSYPFRRTILSIKEFNKAFGFDFVNSDYCEDFDRLVLFIEYVYNLVRYTLAGKTCERAGKSILKHIHSVLDEIHYTVQMDDNHFFIAIPNDSEVVTACSTVSEDDSTLILKYTHHSTQSDVNFKKRVLSRIYEILEPDRYKLNSNLVDIFFSYSNNCNIRHNNVDPGPKHREYFSNLDESQVIELYDNLFKVGLLLLIEKNNLNEIDHLALEKAKACQ